MNNKMRLKENFVTFKAGDIVTRVSNDPGSTVCTVENDQGISMSVPKNLLEPAIDPSLSDTESSLLDSFLTSGSISQDKREVKRTPEEQEEYEEDMRKKAKESKKRAEEAQAKAEEEAKERAKKAAIEAKKAYYKHGRDCLATGIKKRKKPLSEGQCFLSDITGSLPSSGKDYVFTPYNPAKWKKIKGKGWCLQETRTFDPSTDYMVPEIDLNHVPDPDVFEAIYLADILNQKCLLTGDPGTGKSSSYKEYAAFKRQPFMRFNGKNGIDPSAFLGSPWASKEGMEWKDGLLPQGLKLGCMINIDEIFKIPPDIQMAMQHLYEEDGYLILDEKPGTMEDKRVIPDIKCRIFATDNVKGTGDSFDQFAATQVQDTSTLDRFGIKAEVDYLPEEAEVNMLCNKYGIDSGDKLRKTLAYLVKFANLVRSGYRKRDLALTFSPRGLGVTVRLMNEGLTVKRAVELSYMQGLAEDNERQAALKMLKTAGIH